MIDLDSVHHHTNGPLPKLALGAIGVVFGDIGTSPLYAVKETLAGTHPLAVDIVNIYGVIGLIFWSMVLVVTIKYVFVIMHADNGGEGGSLALLALIRRKLGHSATVAWLVPLGLFATALFYADSMITPAVSVLSAVEGLEVVSSGFAPFVVPIALIILIGLFVIQARGTERVGRLFGPVMLVYFAVIAAMGVINIPQHWPVLWESINPIHMIEFFAVHPALSFLSLGAIIYAVTGAEALYADMGHFGRRPIALGWLAIVLPALILNYMGQAAMLLEHPERLSNPFFLMVPQEFLWPLVILATLATVIASQAVISGAYSVTQQAIQLGFVPRLKITHTSSNAAGQIYLPTVNWFLAVMVALLVISFRSSAALLPAYGLAVAGTMLITTIMLAVMIFRVWHGNRLLGAVGILVFLIVDVAYLSSGLAKLMDGAWFPIIVGLIIFTLLTTWARGRQLMHERLAEAAMPVSLLIQSATASAARVSGTAVFMTSATAGVPPALLHNLKHNKVLHERVILLTVQIKNMPFVDDAHLLQVEDLGRGFHRVILRYGFMQTPDVPAALAKIERCGPKFSMMETSFFLSRQTLLASARPGWRSGAKNCSPGCCATRKARWSFSACRPTASSNSAARSKSDGPAVCTIVVRSGDMTLAAGAAMRHLRAMNQRHPRACGPDHG